MNILIISRGIPSSRDAQWGSFEYDQAKALASAGHNVIVSAIDTRFRLYHRKRGITIGYKDGVKTYCYYNFPFSPLKIFGFKAIVNILKRQWSKLGHKILQNEAKIDIIYSHYLFNSYYAVHCLKMLNAPVVAIEHWSDINKEPLPQEVIFYAKATYPLTKRVITVSKSLKQKLQQLFNIKAEVVYNMVGSEFSYQPIIRKLPKIRYVATGSLLRRKGFDLLPKAFQLAGLPSSGWELDIIGEGEEHKNLQKQIDESGFTNNIHLLGAKNKTEIAELLNRSDVFVLPSRNENFSVAVLEALACGLPVIASICGGIRECIDEKNGLLFEVDDVEGLAGAIRYMYENSKTYNRQAIADNCQSRFSPEVIARQLTDIFEKI